MLERKWRERNPHSLLVRAQTNIATVEINFDIPQKLSNQTTICPRDSLPGQTQRSPFPAIEIFVPTFIATIFTIKKNQNQPHCPLTDEWIENSVYS